MIFDDYALKILKDRYLVEGESVNQAFWRACNAYADNPAHAARLYGYLSKKWFMFSTPILTNGGTSRGLPISCYLNSIGDSLRGILNNIEEDTFLSSRGGGVGTYIGALRSNGTRTSRGSSSTGSIPFIKVLDSLSLAISQGDTRRGGLAVYQDISHPEVEEFLQGRKVHGGDINRKFTNLHHGINITDDFMNIIYKACTEGVEHDNWPLIDPHSGAVTSIVSAKELWETILTNRVSTGEPYIHYIDTSNNKLPEPLKQAGLKIRQSNLCSEIILPTDENRTAVCCLSSVNLEYYDEWKDTPMVRDIVRMLDNVLTDFIHNAPQEMWRAQDSAASERSIGLGAMGFHSYLQSKGVPFESAVATSVNKRMFKHIREQAEYESEGLAKERGAPPLLQGTAMGNKRFSHLMAVAPNASSSILCGNTSPSIEPFKSNVYKQKTDTGTNIAKNKHLEKLLIAKGLSDAERAKIWGKISDNHGSVADVKQLSDDEKTVFRTAIEIDQRWVIDHAADRQVFIDQAQSVNLFFRGNEHKSYVHDVHLRAWKKGLKTLYYGRSETDIKVENTNIRIDKFSYDEPTCLACEG